MQTSLKIAFHQLPPSPAVEARVRDLVEDLEKVFDRIVSCRVSIEAPHHHHQHGALYRVGIELGVPGARLVVGHAPDHDAAHQDLHLALRDSFRAAQRKLDDYVSQQRH